MPVGTAISVVVHVTLVAVMLVFAGVRPFKSTPAEAITVDIVAEKDAPPKIEIPDFDFTKADGQKPAESTAAETKAEEAKPPESKPPESKPPESKPSELKPPEPQKPDTKAAEKTQPEKLAAAPPQALSPQALPPQALSPQALQQQQMTPPPAAQQQGAPPQSLEQPVPQAAPIPYADMTQKFANLTGSDNKDFDAPAMTSAKVSRDTTAALRERMKSCLPLPKSVAPDDNVKIVMRIWLRPDGKLARDPELIEAPNSEKGPALVIAAMKGVAACQPYTELPADKYKEWKTLDLSFTPRDFRS